MRGLSLLVHGHSKVGKSWLGSTTPAPRLVLDAEGGSRFTPGTKVVWDPTKEAPPEAGDWETCLVYVHDFAAVLQAYAWLNSGQHPFRSVSLDSVSEIQQRCVDSLVGTDQMKTQDWGTLLRQVSAVVRNFRDLVTHQTRPLDAVVLIAMTRQVETRWRPYVQGQLATVLPYYVDVCGYLFTEQMETGALRRRLLVAPHADFEAGERVGGRLGAVVDDPDVSVMINTVFGTDQ